MKKLMKRIGAVLMAVAMMAALGVTGAFASELPAGTKDAAKTLTIKSPDDLAATDTTTYNVYKVFDATSNGTNSNINYTIISGKANSIVATDGLSKFETDGAGNVHYYTRATNVADWTENSTATELSAGMIEAIGTYVKDDASIGTVTITGPNTEKTVTVPDYGYYYITTTTGTVVTINSTNPSASVSDKNTVPTVEKTITNVSNNGTVDADGESANGKIGDIVTYSVDVNAKKGAINYIFHDKLSAGLSLENQSNLTVKVGDATVSTANYSVQYWNDTDATATDGNGDCNIGDNITIRFANSYLATITEDTTITISYKAKINDDAVIASSGNPNTVVLDYGHDPTKTSEEDQKKPTKKTEEDEATVYTYALALKKVNSEGQALADATFQLPFYVKATADDDGAYIYAGTAAGTGLVNTLTTPASGEITIKGIQNDTAYTFEETVAPNGYNKLTASFDVTPTKTGATVTTTSKETYLDESGNIIEEKVDENTTTVTYTNENMAVGAFYTVVNKAGTALPSTGGIGTYVFTVAGVAIMAIAAGLLIVRHKKKAE